MPVHSPFLRYFDEVRKCGSIRQAARNLYVASSAINRQIQRAEAALGVQLLERSSGGVVLTPAGERLADHVERTLRDADRTMESIRELTLRQAPAVVIAGQESVIAHLLPPTLLALHAEFPDIQTAFKAAGGEQLHEMLRSGHADVALAFDPAPDTGIQIHASCSLPVGAIVTPAHPLADRTMISLTACAAYPIVLPDESWPLRRLLDQELAHAELAPQVITSSNSIEFLRAMLDKQLGVGFQTVVGIEAAVTHGQLVHMPLVNPDPVYQQLSICTDAAQPGSPWRDHLIALLTDRIATYMPSGGAESASPAS